MGLLILIIPVGLLILMLVLLPVKILGWMIALFIGLFPVYNIWILKNCSGDCNIRIDLVFIIPILVFMVITWSVRKYLARRKIYTPSSGAEKENS